MKLILAVIFCINFVYSAVIPGTEFELPEGIPSCDQNDPELNKCIKEAVNFMLPKLSNGLDVLNIPPLDPFVMDKNRFDVDYGSIQASLLVRDVNFYGMSKGIVTNVNTKLTEDGLKSVMKWHLPNARMEGKYKANVKINDLKMSPKGYFNVTMDDINTVFYMTGVLDTQNGVKFLRLTGLDMKPEIGDMHISMTGLFADELLNEVTVDFLNQNWRQMMQYMLPATRDRWEPILLENANQFLLKVPIEALLTNKRV